MFPELGLLDIASLVLTKEEEDGGMLGENETLVSHENRAALPAEVEELFEPPPTILTDILRDYALVAGEQLPQGLRLAERLRDKRIVVLKLLSHSAQALSELGAWQMCLPHPNIVPLDAIYENQFRPGHPLLELYLSARAGSVVPPGHRFLVAVMPRMECDMLDLLCKPGPELSVARKKEAMRQVLAAMAHIHRQGYVHADVKLENILIESQEPLSICLCDFGFARLAAVRPTSRQYSRSYIAPEAIASYEHALQQRGEFLTLGPSIDVWAFGVVAFMILAKSEPFPLVGGEQSARITAASKFPPNFRQRVLASDLQLAPLQAALSVDPPVLAGAEAMLRRVLAVDPAARGSAADLLASEAFFQP